MDILAGSKLLQKSALLFAVTNSVTYMSTGRPSLWGLSIRMALAVWWGRPHVPSGLAVAPFQAQKSE